MTLKQLMNKCLYSNYETVPETKGDYKVFVSGTKLFIFFDCSDQVEDWKHNFDFPARPYNDMPKTWRAHRGFVKVWKSIIPHIEEFVLDPQITHIVAVGYSHGAALACLAQEYIWFNRPDIRSNCFAFAFEPPRVFCGLSIPKELKERWKNLYVFRNGEDLVTHLPPALFGFKHVGKVIRIGKKRENLIIREKLWGKAKHVPKCLLEHDFPNVLNSLEEYEANLSQSDDLKEALRRISEEE